MTKPYLSFALAFVFLALLNSGCTTQNSDSKPLPDAIAKMIEVTATELPLIAGSYESPKGRLFIGSDGAYALKRNEELSLRSSPDSKTKIDYYPICSTAEFGTVTISQLGSQTWLNFKATAVDILSTHMARRGTDELDPSEGCKAYAESRKKSVLSQRYERIGRNGLSLRHWDSVSDGTFQSEAVSFKPIAETPYKIGELFGRVSTSVDVTGFVSEILANAEAPKSDLERSSPPSLDFKFDPASRRFALVYNACDMEMVFTAKILLEDRKLKIVAEDIVLTRSLVSEPSPQPDANSARTPDPCTYFKRSDWSRDLTLNGPRLEFTSWMSLHVEIPVHGMYPLYIHKNIPEKLRNMR